MLRGRSILTVTNEITYLPAIQSFAREFSREMGFGLEDQEKILLAVEEAVVNVIEHAFESAEQSFQIIFEPSPGGIKIIIKDKGLPYDPRLVPGYTAPDGIEEVSPRGLGSFIMKKCVDEVYFCNLGKEGKELHLLKHLPARNITEHEALEPKLAPEPADQKTSASTPPVFTVRSMEPSEALEVSRLFYQTYGYSYLSDVMYYPDRLAELNRQGLVNSVVAVSEQGEIAGHLAMVRERPDDIIAETGKGAVKASFRGFDLFTRMQECLNDKAKTVGLRGMFGRAVTVHTYSQRMMEKTGYKDCAVVLGCVPADIVFKGIEEKLSQRETCVHCFRAIVELPVTTVYLPAHHEAIIRKIYSNLGQERNFATTPGDAPLPDFSVINVKVFAEANSAEMVIKSYGSDCLTLLRSQLRDLCVKKIDQITLFLNLGDPHTGSMCKEIEEMGFFMAGVMPCLCFDDTLILQYLNNIVMDHSRIKLYTDMAKEILAYIKPNMS